MRLEENIGLHGQKQGAFRPEANERVNRYNKKNKVYVLDFFLLECYIISIHTMYDYIEACDTESTVELLKSSVVTFVNWNSKDSGKDVSNLFESDLSNRIDGQIENLPLPWEAKRNGRNL